MTDRERRYEGVSKAAWGYLLFYFDINLGTINLLPQWGAMLLFLGAVKLLQEDRRDLALLRPLGILLAVWHGILWGLACFGIQTEGRFPIAELLAAVVGIYFQFQLVTDLAALAREYQKPEDELDQKLLKWRTLQTLMLTALAVVVYLPIRQWEVGAGIMVVLGGLGLVAGLCLMANLFALRRCFREEASAGDGR